MKNAYAISSLSRQMVKVCEQIDSLAMGVQDTEQSVGDVVDTYQDMLLDELEHVQVLTLKLTEMISLAVGEETANADEGEGSAFAEGERDEFQRLADKFEASAALLQDKHIELDTQADFLKSNQTQLENMAHTLEQQFLGIEDVDPAEAISQLSWAKYCYNTALKVGNSILSQSLMDYINADPKRSVI